MTTYVEIKTLAGDSMMLDFTVVDQNGVAIDLSTAALRWGIKPKPIWKTDCVPVISKATGVDENNQPLGIAVIGNAHNVARVSIGKGDIPAGQFMHELEVTLATGDSFTAAAGPFDATPTIFAN